jgi:DNA-binding MarR family transcriptional regulator
MSELEREAAGPAQQPIQTAASYKEAFPWADLEAIKVSLKIIQSSAAQSAALARFHGSFGSIKSHGRYTLLRILYFARGDPLTQVEITNLMKVTSPNITYLIGVLEKDGLVERRTDPQDRRASLVELTPAGVALAERQVPAMAEFMTRMSEGFSEEEKAQFYDYLERFRQNADGYLAGG